MQGKRLFVCLFFCFFTALSLCACSSGGPSDSGASSQPRATLYEFLSPVAPGEKLYKSGGAYVDASCTNDGYIMVKYSGKAGKAKVQITAPDGEIYAYSLNTEEYEAFPLSSGDGQYRVDVLENVYDNMYAISLSKKISVTIKDEFTPFLYPNQYVWYTPDSQVVQKGIELSQSSYGDLDYVGDVYKFVTKNIRYDKELARNVSPGYLPDNDKVLETKTGICFDYASLMAALLRSQGIPTKLVVGYSGTAYHAWISVYITEIGWVDKIIQFDGVSWSLMDPTLASGNNRNDVSKYIGDGSNYTVKYSY